MQQPWTFPLGSCGMPTTMGFAASRLKSGSDTSRSSGDMVYELSVLTGSMRLITVSTTRGLAGSSMAHGHGAWYQTLAGCYKCFHRSV